MMNKERTFNIHNKDYYQTHKEQQSKNSKRRYEEHKEELQEKNREYAKNS